MGSREEDEEIKKEIKKEIKRNENLCWIVKLESIMLLYVGDVRGRVCPCCILTFLQFKVSF